LTYHFSMGLKSCGVILFHMKVATAVLLAALTCLSNVKIVYAHPGNTDSSGGHTCRTNCESWGYSYGEYHYHGGGYYEEPDYYDQGAEEGSEHVNKNSDYIISHAKSSGSENGRNAGETGEASDNTHDSDSFCSEVNFSDQSGPPDYYDGFLDAYRDGCNELYDEHYVAAYDEAYLEGEEKYNNIQARDNNNHDSGNSEGGRVEDWSWLLWMGAIATSFVIAGNWESIRKWWREL